MGGQPFHNTVFYLAEDFLRHFRFHEDAPFHHRADVYFLDDYCHRRYLMRSKRLYTSSTVSMARPLCSAFSPATSYLTG